MFVQFVLMLLVQFIKPPLRLKKKEKKKKKKRKPRQQREGVCLLVWDCGCKGRKTPKVGCEKSSRISEMIRDFDRFYNMTRHLSTRLPREQLGSWACLQADASGMQAIVCSPLTTTVGRRLAFTIAFRFVGHFERNSLAMAELIPSRLSFRTWAALSIKQPTALLEPQNRVLGQAKAKQPSSITHES